MKKNSNKEFIKIDQLADIDNKKMKIDSLAGLDNSENIFYNIQT
jgi:hypothetical protein